MVGEGDWNRVGLDTVDWPSSCQNFEISGGCGNGPPHIMLINQDSEFCGNCKNPNRSRGGGFQITVIYDAIYNAMYDAIYILLNV